MKHTILRSINLALTVTFLIWLLNKPPYIDLLSYLTISFIVCCWQGIVKEYISTSYIIWNASLVISVNLLAYIVLDYVIPVYISITCFALACLCDKLRHTKL